MKLYISSGDYKKVGNFPNIDSACKMCVKDALKKDIDLGCLIHISKWGFISDMDVLTEGSAPVHMIEKYLDGSFIKTQDILNNLANNTPDFNERIELRELAEELENNDIDEIVKDIAKLKKKIAELPKNAIVRNL